MQAEMSEDEDLPTPPQDGMSATEKVAMWDTTECSNLLPELAHVDQKLDEAEEPLRYQEVRSA